MTGFASEEYIFGSYTDDQIWLKILEASEKNYLIGCSCIKKNGIGEDIYINNNLVLNHAYSVLKAVTFEGKNLILIKNP